MLPHMLRCRLFVGKDKQRKSGSGPTSRIRCTVIPVRCSPLQVEEGSDLFISVWNLHRSPALWDRPNEFVPDRFPVDKPTPTEVTHSFAYLPFGGGRRKCIGARFLTLTLPRPTFLGACCVIILGLDDRFRSDSGLSCCSDIAACASNAALICPVQ